jgi:translation initiation factor IF-1
MKKTKKGKKVIFRPFPFGYKRFCWNSFFFLYSGVVEPRFDLGTTLCLHLDERRIVKRGMIVSLFFLLIELFSMCRCFQSIPPSRVIFGAFRVRLQGQSCGSVIPSLSLFEPLRHRRLSSLLFSSTDASVAPTTEAITSSPSPTVPVVSPSTSTLLPNGKRRRTGPRPVKAGKDIIQVVAQIVEKLKNKAFRCELIPSRQPIKAAMCGRLRTARFTNIGDYVTLELSPYDLSVGRVVWLHGRQLPTSPVITSGS